LVGASAAVEISGNLKDVRGSWALRSLVGALFLFACGRSGSGTQGSGGGGAAGGGATDGGAAGTAGAGMADAAGTGTAGGGMAGGSAAGAGVAGGSGTGGSTGGAAGGAGAGGAATGGAATGGAGAGASCLPHDLDLPSVYVTSQISVQGLPSSTGDGTLDFRTAAGDIAFLGTTTLADFVTVLPGTYDVYYRLDKAGPGLPVNQLAKIMGGVVVPPDGLASPLDVVVPATPVSVALTLTGITTSNVNGTSIHLRTAGGDDATLATSATPVVPGTYDVYYVPAYATIGPLNQSAKLQSGFVVGGSAATLNVNVPATTVSGTFTLGGSKAAPASGAGVLFLETATDGALIAQTLGAYTATVIQGTYDLYYQAVSAVSGVNAYQVSKLQSGIVAGSTPLALNADVPITTVSGTITVNGAQVASTAGVGRLILQNATTTWPFAPTTSDPYSATPAATYSTAIMPGTYDLYYKVTTAGTGVPSNASVKLRSGVVIGGTGPQTLDIDIPATKVTGTITVNGAQVDASMGTGGLHLRNAAGDDALLGTTGMVGPYSQLVVPGTYDLYYAFINGGTGVPYNQSAELRSGIVVGSTPLALNIDVSAPMVSGMISVNGMQMPGNPNALADLILQAASGDKANLGSTYSATYARLVIAGTYELMYEINERGLGIPDNTLGDLGCYNVP
jgi:hypothetical protein